MRTWRCGIRAVLAVALLSGAGRTACSPLDSKGTMPPPGPNGQADTASAPDFVAVAGPNDGIAGYVRKEALLDPGDASFPVYGEDLQTVVGQLVPGKGFIPAGVDPATVLVRPIRVAPSSDASPESRGQVRLYVRNDSLTQIYDAVMVGAQITNSGGYWGQDMGVGCYAMPTGSRLVLLDRSAAEPGASVVRLIYTRTAEPDPPSLWITVAKDGSVQQGVGLPGWWGPPQSC